MSNETQKQPDALRASLQIDNKTTETVYSPDVVYSRLTPSPLVEIGLVTDGNGIHRIINQELPCSEGDIFIVNANVPHGYFAGESGAALTVRTLSFSPSAWLEGNASVASDPRFCYGVFQEGSTAAYAMLNAKTLDEVKAAINHMEVERNHAQPDWESAVRAHLSLLLITVGRYINDAIKSDVSQKADTVRPQNRAMIASIIHTIAANYGDPELTQERIASDLFISTSRLSRMFQQIMGISFSRYLRTIRMDNACRLLKDTEMNVEEIVKAVGLRDVPTFYNVFASQIGCTPKHYRTEQKNKLIEEAKGKKVMSILSEISTQLQAGKAKLVKEMVQQAIDEGISAETILKEGLVAGMNVIGEKFKNNEVFVPEVLVAARAMNQGASLLKPLLVQEGVKSVGKVCIGTVQGDLHDIGKNIVKMMLEGKGFEVIDLGTDVPAETFVTTAKEQNCQIICCSALLTTTMGVMGDVVKAAEAAGIRDQVKIMIGGAPITEDFCREIGADAYTSDAASCADRALAFCQ